MEPVVIAIIAYGVGMGSILIALGVWMVIMCRRMIRRLDALIERFDALLGRGVDSREQYADAKFDARQQHVDARFDARQQHVDARFDTLQQSISELKQGYARLEGMMEVILKLLSRTPSDR